MKILKKLLLCLTAVTLLNLNVKAEVPQDQKMQIPSSLADIVDFSKTSMVVDFDYFKYSDYKKGKVNSTEMLSQTDGDLLLLFVFAGDCDLCAKETPGLVNFAHRFAGNRPFWKMFTHSKHQIKVRFLFFSQHTEKDKAKLKEYVERFNIPENMVIVNNGMDFFRDIELETVPHLFVMQKVTKDSGLDESSINKYYIIFDFARSKPDSWGLDSKEVIEFFDKLAVAKKVFDNFEQKKQKEAEEAKKLAEELKNAANTAISQQAG